jgi:hypothetical protein
MKSTLEWGLLAAVLAAFIGTAVPVHATCGVFDLNPCTAGKLKCVVGKKSCLLGCYKRAANGVPVDPACLQKCRNKFDGAGIAAKSCFGKLEAKGGCLTTLDTAALGRRIEGFVQSIVATLHDTSPVGIGSKCLAGKESCLSGYDKCRLGVMSGAAKHGLAPDPAKLQKCRDKIDACYPKLEASVPSDCLTHDDVAAIVRADDLFVDEVIADLVAGQRDMNTQRCTGDTSVTCTSAPGGVAGCGGALGTCEFWFGSTLPLSAGGVSTCVTNQWNGTISGTANPETGASAGSANLLAKVYVGITVDRPCPTCVGDTFPNDGTAAGCLLGTCNGGARNGLPCDVNGVSPNLSFGSTSLDCPPNPGGLIAALPIDLGNANNATRALTLSASSPGCTGAGFVGQKCFCDTCNNTNAEPCSANADCPDPAGPLGPICGGRRCLGGANVGAACSAHSECPGGNICVRPGEPTKPNSCIDDSSTPGFACADVAPVGDGEGECSDGPVDTHCAIDTQRGCLGPADCPAPGDSCLAVDRPCYLDNGAIGGQVAAQGQFATPIDHWSHPTFASVFCIAPTASAAVNNVAGLPGAGRLALDGDAGDDGTAGSCPTRFTFLPTAKGGVLDTGWTGVAHAAKAIGQAKVTVSATCPGGPPPLPCGDCTYTGPIANADALP